MLKVFLMHYLKERSRMALETLIMTLPHVYFCLSHWLVSWVGHEDSQEISTFKRRLSTTTKALELFHNWWLSLPPSTPKNFVTSADCLNTTWSHHCNFMSWMQNLQVAMSKTVATAKVPTKSLFFLLLPKPQNNIKQKTLTPPPPPPPPKKRGKRKGKCLGEQRLAWLGCPPKVAARLHKRYYEKKQF